MSVLNFDVAIAGFGFLVLLLGHWFRWNRFRSRRLQSLLFERFRKVSFNWVLQRVPK